MLLMQRFVERARSAFCSRLLHRITRSRIAVSAIAEVVVETAMDFVAVLRGRMSFDDLLRRFGVHVATAAGAAAGAAVAAALTCGMAPIVVALSMLFGGYVGSRGGRALGEAIFVQPNRSAPCTR
jgi:hypothetical protein